MRQPFPEPPAPDGKRPPEPPMPDPSEPVELRLVSLFFRLMHTPWMKVPAPGLTNSETRILFAVRGSEHTGHPIRVRDLSRMLRVSSPTITQHINSLEGRGLVLREQSPKDKREVHIALTELGNSTLEGHRDVLLQNFREFAEYLGGGDAEKLAELIAKTCEFFNEKEKQYSD